jgi:hypothetical protein
MKITKIEKIFLFLIIILGEKFDQILKSPTKRKIKVGEWIFS